MKNPKEKCLAIHLNNDTLALLDCSKEMTQKWIFGYVNQTAFESFDSVFGYTND